MMPEIMGATLRKSVGEAQSLIFFREDRKVRPR